MRSASTRAFRRAGPWRPPSGSLPRSFSCGIFLARCEEGLNDTPDSDHSRRRGLHHDRIDEGFDVLTAGVVRAELRALVRSMPRSKRVPKTEGSMALQSSLAALRISFSSSRSA